MNNIFENAKFGDKFRTRDGRMAIFIQGAYPIGYMIAIFKEVRLFSFFEDGSFKANKESPIDIVSEWQEEINVEELDKIAEEYVTKYATPHTSQFVDMINGFKAGYRKAKES